MIAVYIVLGLFAVLLAVLLIRAAAFTPKKGPDVDPQEETFDKEAVINRLAELIKCKTVSYRDPSLEDEAEFKKLIALLPTLYPLVFKTCEYTELADRGLLFRWKGKGEGDPAVLMAHYDVVPVDEAGWDKPPFEAIIEDGVLWGRGSLDTKVTFGGILSAAEHLIEKGFVPENDIYFAFSGGEEVNGKGASNIVDLFEKQGITPALVVDEGGAVVEKVFPGVKAPCGLIGIAEKGMMDVKYTAKSKGGHASAPKPGSPIARLSEACIKMEKHPFKYHITPPVEKLFDTLGRHSSFVFRLVFSNMWLFGGLIDTFLCKKSGGEINALMRTTVAFTQADGSKASNVIPPSASLVSNIRLNPMDNMDSALEYIKNTVGDEVEVTCLHGMNPSRISRTDCEGYSKVASAVASTWKGCIVSPYLMVQCSDSRHWGRISDKVYRFSAMDLTAEERATIHGNNEGIRLDCACRAVEFYIRLIKKC
ncbi:MAG: M20/M25/M40 family metallo-hydrolase [Acutalibacteraceae bacterium]|nr:M20/M25/M40 family metallo-hydrolase [Acutalibacteraceae bacterium]